MLKLCRSQNHAVYLIVRMYFIASTILCETLERYDQRISDFVPNGSNILSIKAGICSLTCVHHGLANHWKYSLVLLHMYMKAVLLKILVKSIIKNKYAHIWLQKISELSMSRQIRLQFESCFYENGSTCIIFLGSKCNFMIFLWFHFSQYTSRVFTETVTYTSTMYSIQSILFSSYTNTHHHFQIACKHNKKQVIQVMHYLVQKSKQS